MHLTLEQMTNGLTPEHDLFFPEKPDQPEMRESTSIWLFEENGEFALPRIGIEGEASSWDDRLHQSNFALGGGRILDGAGRGPVPSPFGPDGRPTVFGAGPLTFRCIEPFRRWAMTFDGPGGRWNGRTADQPNARPGETDPDSGRCRDGDGDAGLGAGQYADKVARLSAAEADEATAWASVSGSSTGSAPRARSRRWHRATSGRRLPDPSTERAPARGFRGHAGSRRCSPTDAPSDTSPTAGRGRSEPYNEGYVYQDGKMYPARAIRSLAAPARRGKATTFHSSSSPELGVATIGGLHDAQHVQDPRHR